MTYATKAFFTGLFFTISCLSVFASSSASYTLEVLDNSSFILNLEAATQPEIQITIKDNSGHILHEETIFQNSITDRNYDLQNLPANTYSLVIDYDNVVMIQPIEKGNFNLVIDQSAAFTILKPVFRHAPGFVTLDFFSPSNSSTRLYILDLEGRIIYEESYRLAGPLQKKFNLLQLGSGEYTFKIVVRSEGLDCSFKEPIIIDTDLLANN